MKRPDSSEMVEIILRTDALEHQLRSSRKTSSLPSFCYLARRNRFFDGYVYLEAVLKGGGLFVGERDELEMYFQENSIDRSLCQQLTANPHLLLVKDRRATLRHLARAAIPYGPKEFRTIGITGTNGKTSTAHMVSQLLSQLTRRDNLLIGSLGARIGMEAWSMPFPTMPDFAEFSLLLQEAYRYNVQDIVMEVTSTGMADRRFHDWQCDVAVFTNFSRDHLNVHKTLEDYMEAKLSLFRNHMKDGGTAVIRFGSKPFEPVLEIAKAKGLRCIIIHEGRALTTQPEPGTIYLEIGTYTSNDEQYEMGEVRVVYGTGQEAESVRFTSPFTEPFHHENLTNAIAVLLALGYSLAEICALVPNLSPVPGRMEPVQLLDRGSSTPCQNPRVFLDFAHNEDGLRHVLAACRQLLRNGGRLVHVFGAQGDRDRGKRPAMGAVSAAYADSIYITSDSPRSEDPNAIAAAIRSGIEPADQCKVCTVLVRKDAIASAIAAANYHDIVIITGKMPDDVDEVAGKLVPYSDRDVALEVLGRDTSE